MQLIVSNKGGNHAFLHTSDWHLAVFFIGLHMTDDQAIVLEELIALVKEVMLTPS